MTTAFAHTSDHSAPEILYTPGVGCPALSGNFCPACANLDPKHGHLNKVAWLCGEFAAAMVPPATDQEAQARAWGRAAGLWHDLGKFSAEFQAYLRKAGAKADPHREEPESGLGGRVDHSTAGAVVADQSGGMGSLLAYLIAGHHAGLADAAELFPERLRKFPQERRDAARAAAVAAGMPGRMELPDFPLRRPDAGWAGCAAALRMYFSCLVDADFLATEAFMDPAKAGGRTNAPDDVIPRMDQALQAHLASSFPTASAGRVAAIREKIRVECEAKAVLTPGFFSLTVPTGGGKTLSSLAFALKQALQHNLRRVIYAIPYTSIIEQNAGVFQSVFRSLSDELGTELVLEHHSNFEPDAGKDSLRSRLATENWDAPLVVTTNVQLFESLHANRTSACRKLHRLARSVIVLDEAQSLPARLLAPVLNALKSLVLDFGATVVFCTATQPGLGKRGEFPDGEFPIGLPEGSVREIISDRVGLFAELKRVRTADLGKADTPRLLAEAESRAPEGSLIIVNTTKAARETHLRWKSLLPEREIRHLSARMCPAHRAAVLQDILARSKPVRLVSTPVIEAGVDISFPAVFRARCGLDSFAQSAGRCNRNGELPEPGQVFLFDHTDQPIPRPLSDLRNAAGILDAHILGNFSDDELLSLEALHAYSRHALWLAGQEHRWDGKDVLGCFGNSMRAFSFKSAAQRFRLIDSPSRPIVIPWGEPGRRLAGELRGLERAGLRPNRDHHRRMQRFSVNVFPHEWAHILPLCDSLFDGEVRILIHPQNDYCEETGLKAPDMPDNDAAFRVES